MQSKCEARSCYLRLEGRNWFACAKSNSLVRRVTSNKRIVPSLVLLKATLLSFGTLYCLKVVLPYYVRSKSTLLALHHVRSIQRSTGYKWPVLCCATTFLRASLAQQSNKQSKGCTQSLCTLCYGSPSLATSELQRRTLYVTVTVRRVTVTVNKDILLCDRRYSNKRIRTTTCKAISEAISEAFSATITKLNNFLWPYLIT